jgi:chitinase
MISLTFDFTGRRKERPMHCNQRLSFAYYEIQDILKKNKKRDLTVIHDKEAAVKYFSWDNDQWIYHSTMQTGSSRRKTELTALGSLVWAFHLDDSDNTAHKAFTGNRNLGSRKDLKKANNQKQYTEIADSSLGQGFKFHETVVSEVKSYDCGKNMESALLHTEPERVE